ncbi:MAG: hydrogenase formation protein HypD [Gammaproteobacteria bacterium]|nr:MAG: hydrogenase formation protein HypD [Gammaproteobacteria bacterium]
MRYVDEYRAPDAVRVLLDRVSGLLQEIAPASPLQIMEFCGGHTHAIFRFGLHQTLPEGSVEWVHGPGCPVCVLPRESIDTAIDLARRPGVTLTTFGDVLRVPGTRQSLLQAAAEGADVRVVYSPLDALALAREHPDREIVFLAIGFETTMPATALTLLQAVREGLGNFSLLCRHITTPAAVRAVLQGPDPALDGVIAPGHVATVLGSAAFDFIPRDYRLPVVVSGFEPVDLLHALERLLLQRLEGRCAVENGYARAVREQGLPPALDAIGRVYELRGEAGWRGLGRIADSAVRLRTEYADFDAERRFGSRPTPASGEEPLPCGEVMRGRLRPPQCPWFGTRCRPDAPLGALMVSAEGACAAYHRYRGSSAP